MFIEIERFPAGIQTRTGNKFKKALVSRNVMASIDYRRQAHDQKNLKAYYCDSIEKKD